MNATPACRICDLVRVKRLEVGGREILVRVWDDRDAPSPPYPWMAPSAGDHPLYDEKMYAMMRDDEFRNRLFHEAIARHVRGKRVVDIGTGQFALWAIACVEAGAEKVYAIEVIDSAFESATAEVRKRGLDHRIELIRGVSTEVELPERVDVCVAEIIGHVGSSEGATAVLADARARFLKPEGVIIPERCTTRVAAFSLPDLLRNDLGMHPNSLPRLERLFSHLGYPHDFRILLGPFDDSCLLSEPGIFEDLDFSGPVEAETTRAESLEINRRGRLDGLVVWIELKCLSSQAPLSSLGPADESWWPILLPVFFPGVAVTPGDRVELSIETRLSDNRINPDYSIAARATIDGVRSDWSFTSEHHGRAWRSGPFYEALFPLEPPLGRFYRRLDGGQLRALRGGRRGKGGQKRGQVSLPEREAATRF